MDFIQLGDCVQLSINEGGFLNMCLVYWEGLVGMGSMLTGDMKVIKDQTAFVALSLSKCDSKHQKPEIQMQMC